MHLEAERHPRFQRHVEFKLSLIFPTRAYLNIICAGGFSRFIGRCLISPLKKTNPTSKKCGILRFCFLKSESCIKSAI